MHRPLLGAGLALMLAAGGCSRLKDADLPGPPEPDYAPALVEPDARVKGWRYLEQRPAAEEPPVPFVAFRDNGVTVSLSCFGNGESRPVRVGVTQRQVYRQDRTIGIRYRFDDQDERRSRWRWYQDTAAQTGAGAIAFARSLARRNVLYIHLEGGPPQTLSLRGSAGPIGKLLAACGHPMR